MKRNAIVLMMTLVLIVVLMGITALILSQGKTFVSKAQDPFSKSATLRIVNDLERELPAFLEGVTGAQELDIAMRLPVNIESKKGDFVLKVTLSSPYSKLNINRLCDANGTVNKGYYDVWSRIFEHYPIADTDLFFQCLLDAIDADSVERGINTEIGASEGDFKNINIVSMEQFAKILERYIALSTDKSVLDVPWSLYVGFKGERVDVNAMTSETLSLLLPQMPQETLRQITTHRDKAFTSKDEAIAKVPMLAGVFDPFLFVYQPNSAYVLVCDVEITQGGKTQRLRFDYDMLDKKMKNIEFL